MIDITPILIVPAMEQEVILPDSFADTPGAVVGGFQAAPGELRQGKVAIQGLQERILIGDATEPTTGTGIFIGSDGNSNYDFRAGNPSGNYLHWDGSAATLTISGTITASAIDIGGADATSFHVDTDGNMWLGASTFAAAPAKISNAGVGTFSNIAISGGTITGTPIASIPNNSSTDISLLDLTHNLVFSATDADTAAWASGTITLSNGRTFSISGGNTGNMSAKTYIYLDTAVSSTALQTTTTFSTAIGANKKLIAIAQNDTTEAIFQVYGGAGGVNINADSITVAQISAIAADLGTITAGTITGATVRTASSGTRFQMTSSAFQGINANGDTVFEIILSGNVGDVIVGDDATGSYAMWDNSAGTFEVFADNVPTLSQAFFGGDGSDGALSITSGTTTIDCGNASVVVKNYTSISITGTGKLAFSNPASTGTTVILKSQGNVTLTSSQAPMIDMSGMGAAGGAAVPRSSNGTDPGIVGTDGTTDFTYFTTNKGLVFDGIVNNDETGAAAITGALSYKSGDNHVYASKFPFAFNGAGGASGRSNWTTGSAAGTVTSGAGGRGGGSLIIECGGAFNFTTAGGISVAGAVGGTATLGTTTRAAAGGGGGGGGGYCLILYNTLTAASGTITKSGGVGGAGVIIEDGGAMSGEYAGGGAGGYSAGTDASEPTGSASATGGTGGDGLSFVLQNKFFS